MSRHTSRRDIRDQALQALVDQHRLDALPPLAYEQLLQQALQQAHAHAERERRFVALFRPSNHDGPCRNCSSTGTDDGWHTYGERACCPDCDHRPVTKPDASDVTHRERAHDHDGHRS